jgi:hypothetical protein
LQSGPPTPPYPDSPGGRGITYTAIRLAGVFRRVIVSVRNLFRCLADSMLHERIPVEAVDPVLLAGIQIRFENSS